MTAVPVIGTRSWLAALREEAAAWLETNGRQWLFVIKVPAAALAAMLIAMWLELDQPRTAMITVFVVMKPHTGLVLAKSLYRILGTLAGTFASLLLVGQFAQEPALFLFGLALWVGMCTFGAAFYRNFRSYGFVLAGYTAALVGLPAAMQPAAFFSLATTRLSEIILGIVCAGIFNDIVFPQRLSDAIARNLQRRYVNFIALIRMSLSGSAAGGELHRMQLELTREVIGLESIRSAATLEDAEIRARDFRLRKLNSEFMAVASSFHSFYQLMNRLQKNAAPAGAALAALYERLSEALAYLDDAAHDTQAAHRTARGIAAFRKQLPRQVKLVRSRFCADGGPRGGMDFDTAVELLNRFIRDLHAYTKTYATFPDRGLGSQPPVDMIFATRTDPLVALASGGRAFVAILAVGAFWIASAWPYGISALTFATIVSALCSSAADPSSTAKRMVLGFIFGFVPVLLYKFLVVPSLDGAVLLTATMAPVLLLGSRLAAGSAPPGIGEGFMIFFTSMIAPTNSMNFDPVDVMNDGCATIIGVAVAGILFGTLIPATGTWSKHRLVGQLRQQVVMACMNPREGLAHRFESSTHDLLHTLAGHKEQDLYLLAWVFPVLEIGRAVISLRNDAAMTRLSRTLSARLIKTTRSTARLFDRPSSVRREAAIASVSAAIESAAHAATGEGYGQDVWVLQRMLASLHLIRTVLLDEEMAMVSARPAPTTTHSGGFADAARNCTT